MADELASESSLDISKLKVPDLKRELKLRGLNVSGNKTELIERLQSALKQQDSTHSESVDELEEDLLNDEDDEHLEGSESLLENDLDESPKPMKRKLDEPLEKDKTEPPKKVVLNRNSSFNSDINDSIEKPVENTFNGNKSEEKKIIKLSELSAKERLEMRAKKFGVSDLSLDAKKAVRAERFGNNNSASSITKSEVNTSIDVLKQRAARFGTSVSSVMSSLENKEKLEKRKIRFSGESGSNNLTNDEKAKLRLERFKQPIK